MKIRVLRKIDVGMIMLEVTQDDLKALKPFLSEHNYEEPLIKISIYKNRRGKHKGVLLWCKARRGVCRIEPMFATDYAFRPVEIEDLQIQVTK